MSDRCTVLMYHAIPREPSELGGADPHYAVTLAVFEQHLDAMARRKQTARAVERIPEALARGEQPVGITFDDGHRTNLQAAQALAQRGWCATFFVNTATVGTSDFLSWPELQAMADMGMSIQSHAHHHRYQDELTQAEQLEELNRSKAEIEAQLHRTVAVYAPPGGRTSAHTSALAQQAGYTLVSTSRVGVWRVGQDSVWDVPRFAVLAATPMRQLEQWLDQSPLEIGKQVFRYRALRGFKKLLGNGGYERLRGALLGTPKDY